MAICALGAISVIAWSGETWASGTDVPSCPRHAFDEETLASRNPERASLESTVPGRPTEVLLCRYRGLKIGRPSLTLVRRRLVGDGSTTVRLAALMNQRRPPAERSEAGTFTSGCFLDNGARVYAYFLYPDRPRVLIEVRLHGCFTVRNGRAPDGLLTSRLGRLIRLLVPFPRDGLASAVTT